MQDKDAISFQHWTLKLGRAGATSEPIPPFWGEIASAIADLEQSITCLILTPLGSVPTEPDMGCDLMPWLDRPVDIAIPNITRAVWDAITAWEPRITLQEVHVFEVAFAHLTVEIHWRPVESVLDDLRVTRVPLGQTNRQVA